MTIPRWRQQSVSFSQWGRTSPGSREEVGSDYQRNFSKRSLLPFARQLLSPSAVGVTKSQLDSPLNNFHTM